MHLLLLKSYMAIRTYVITVCPVKITAVLKLEVHYIRTLDVLFNFHSTFCFAPQARSYFLYSTLSVSSSV